jgi:hypothetical protein
MVLQKISLFEELKTDKLEPLSLFLISLLHTEMCSVSLIYDNSEMEEVEL